MSNGRSRRVRERAPRRGGLKGELALAALPSLTVMRVFLLVEVFTRQTFLFASLASSTFLIYKEPENGMNQVKTLVPAHLVAAMVAWGPSGSSAKVTWPARSLWPSRSRS